MRTSWSNVPLDGVAFHDWIEYNGAAFSTALLEWGRTVGHFGGQKIQVGRD